MSKNKGYTGKGDIDAVNIQKLWDVVRELPKMALEPVYLLVIRNRVTSELNYKLYILEDYVGNSKAPKVVKWLQRDGEWDDRVASSGNLYINLTFHGSIYQHEGLGIYNLTSEEQLHKNLQNLLRVKYNYLKKKETTDGGGTNPVIEELPKIHREIIDKVRETKIVSIPKKPVDDIIHKTGNEAVQGEVKEEGSKLITTKREEVGKVGKGQSINLYLTDGTTDGPIKLRMSNWMGYVYSFPIDKAELLIDRDDLNESGIYILANQTHLHVGYISKWSGDKTLIEGIIDNIGHSDWEQVFIILTEDSDFYQPRVLHDLTGVLGERVKRAGGYTLTSVLKERSEVSEDRNSEYIDFIDKVELLIGSIGYRLFKNNRGVKGKGVKYSNKGVPTGVVQSKGTNNTYVYGTILTLKSGSLVAQGRYDPGKFCLLEESEIVTTTESKNLVNPFNNKLRQNHEFGTPSQATDFVLSKNNGGKSAWKDDKGNTFGDNDMYEGAKESIRLTLKDESSGVDAEGYYISDEEVLVLLGTKVANDFPKGVTSPEKVRIGETYKLHKHIIDEEGRLTRNILFKTLEEATEFVLKKPDKGKTTWNDPKENPFNK